AFAIACVLSHSAQATIVEALDTPALVGRADQIVRGRVVAMRAYWDGSHERIWTDVTVRVAETFKGAQAATLVVRRLGGSVGGIGVRTFGEVEFSDGEEVFLFLRRVPSKPTAVYQTVGLAQGKLRIVRDASGARAMADVHGATLMVREPDGRPRMVAPVPTT